MHPASAVVALALLAACSRYEGLEATGQQLTWEDRRPSSYAFTLTYGSMIGGRSERIRVVDGKLASATPVADEQPFLPDIDEALTIDGVYALLRHDLRHADEVEVSYDETWGFPSQVSVDEIASAIDDEHGYSVRQFLALSGPLPKPMLSLEAAVATCRVPNLPKAKARRVFFVEIGGTGQGELRITDAAGRDLIDPRPVAPGQVDAALRPAPGTSTLPPIGRLRLTAGSTVFIDSTYPLSPSTGRC